MRASVVVLAVAAAAAVAAAVLLAGAASAQAPAAGDGIDQTIAELQSMVDQMAPPQGTHPPAAPKPAPPRIIYMAAPAPAPKVVVAAPKVNTSDGIPLEPIPDSDPATNATVQAFLTAHIPVITIDNTTDVSNATTVAEMIAQIKRLIQLDLQGKFTHGHGIHFRHRAWTTVLEQTEKGLLFMKKALEYQISLRNGERDKLKAALKRVKHCIHRIRVLKREGAALRLDLKKLNERIAIMTPKDHTERLRVDLGDASKRITDKHVEAKQAQDALQKARERLEAGMKALGSIMEQIVGRVVYQSSVLTQLDPQSDSYIQNALDILQDHIRENLNRLGDLRKYADNSLNQAARLRATAKVNRAKQVAFFTDEVLQRQRTVDMYTKLLAEAKHRLESGGATPV